MLQQGRMQEPAAQAQVGMTVLTEDGSTAIVESNAVELLDQPVVVYNLTFADGHTYFVEDGQAAATPIWVHNAETCEPQSLYRYGESRESAARLARKQGQRALCGP